MKQHFRKIPDFIREKISSLDNDDFIVASIIKIEKTDFTPIRFRNINLSFDDGEINFSERIVPSEKVGTFSRRNINGYRIVHRDEDKVPKRFYMGERPNWGDWSNGSFSLYVTRNVYPHDEIPPREWIIYTELLEETETNFTIKISIDLVLNRKNNHDEELFFAINLLQENIYAVDIFSTENTREDYLRSLSLTWEIFPLGERDEDLKKIIRNVRNITEGEKERIQRNYDYLRQLNPIEMIFGVSGMRRYFGAKYSDNLVVFENLNYGNAIYVLFENWEELSRLSRTEVLQRSSDEYIRIKHNNGWETKLANIVNNRRNGSS